MGVICDGMVKHSQKKTKEIWQRIPHSLPNGEVDYYRGWSHDGD